jgi:predicted DNA-binding antitoxin AbrB/MazE fold protein
MKQILENYKNAVLVKRELESKLKDANKNLKDMEYKVLEEFERTGLQNLKLATGETVSLRTDVRASILAENREVMYQKFKDHGLDGLVKETIHPKTLESWVREHKTINGIELPDWAEPFVEVYENIRPTILGLK